jgi:hypothetical protein
MFRVLKHFIFDNKLLRTDLLRKCTLLFYHLYYYYYFISIMQEYITLLSTDFEIPVLGFLQCGR